MSSLATSRPRPPLSGPYQADLGPGPLQVSPAVSDLVAAQVQALLSSSAAWHELSPRARAEMRKNLEKISAYTAALVQEDFALSERLGQTPVLRRTRLDPVAEAAADKPPPPPPPPQDAFAPRAVGEVGRVTRDVLGAIAFPTFVADLIKGTFNAIVDASIKQMEAFGTLLANVAKTVDQFMTDNITDNQARDWLAATYPQHFQVSVEKDDDGAARGRGRAARGGARGGGRGRGGGGEAGPARLRVRQGSAKGGTPNFRRDLGLNANVDLDDKAAEEVLVPAARRRLAQQRHQLLSTMVLMGINRIVVTSGRIYARMGFYIDASDTGAAESASQFDFRNDTIAGGGFLGFGMVSKNSVAYVSSQKRNSTDEINVQADLTGEVDLKFKSETFPLERFADTNAIAQIQGNTANPAANLPQSATNGAPPAGATQ
jgi:uncharacterized membrane protein YgcG